MPVPGGLPAGQAPVRAAAPRRAGIWRKRIGPDRGRAAGAWPSGAHPAANVPWRRAALAAAPRCRGDGRAEMRAAAARASAY